MAKNYDVDFDVALKILQYEQKDHALQATAILQRKERGEIPIPSVRTSTLANWYWCAEQARWMALGIRTIPTEAMARGTRIHEELWQERKKRFFPWEIKFLQEMEQYRTTRGFTRFFFETEVIADITGTPDDFQVDKDRNVTIIERKTKGKTSSMSWAFLSPNFFQAEIYGWIFDEICHRMGYHLNPYAVLIYYDVNGDAFDDREVPLKHDETEKKVDTVLQAFRDPEKVIPPRDWKCRPLCQKPFVARCQFEAQGRYTPEELMQIRREVLGEEWFEQWQRNHSNPAVNAPTGPGGE